MPFQMIFGDDEHTAVDGPYARLMKTRKWLYVSAAIAVLFDWDLIDVSAADSIIKIVHIPIPLLHGALIAGLSYLIIQYVLLGFQLSSCYDLILSERFSHRRKDELAAARARQRDAIKNQIDADTALDIMNRKQGLSTSAVAQHEAALAQANTEMFEASDALHTLLAAEPSARALYRVTEVLIDAVRVLPPLVFGSVALFHLIA